MHGTVAHRFGSTHSRSVMCLCAVKANGERVSHGQPVAMDVVNASKQANNSRGAANIMSRVSARETASCSDKSVDVTASAAPTIP